MQGAWPFSRKGDRRGALVLHGVTGSPQSMRPLEKAFAEAGFAVDVPRLPGHGTTVEDMAQYRFVDWAAAADVAYRDLASRTDHIGVAGLSMGGTLSLWLASRHPDIAGLVLVNPAAKADDFLPFVEGAVAWHLIVRMRRLGSGLAFNCEILGRSVLRLSAPAMKLSTYGFGLSGVSGVLRPRP